MPDSRHHHHPHGACETTLTTGQILREICTRNFNIITLVNFLAMSVYYLVFVTSTAYARSAFGLSLSAAGLTSGMLVLGCLAGRFLTGHLISVLGCRTSLFSGLGIIAASIACFFFTDSAASLFAERFATGFGIGVTSTVTGTVVAWVIPAEHRGFGVSIFSMSTALALALGPFFGILLSHLLPYAILVRVNLATICACIAIALALRDLPVISHHHRPGLELNSYIDPRVVRFSLVAIVVCLGYGCTQAFMTSLAAERDLAASASLFFLVYAAATMLTRPLTGRMYDARGENALFYPIFLLTALAFCAMAYAHSALTLLLAATLLGMGFGNFQSLGQAVALSLVTRSRISQATTTFFIFFDFGCGVGPFLMGMIVPHYGYEGMYLALAGTIILAAVMYHFLHGRTRA
ncbi:MAG: MFS transporter [Desulfovibrionaceae bacterium]|nr:MFS transporter [Desulfovibrionaceae bacterium]